VLLLCLATAVDKFDVQHSSCLCCMLLGAQSDTASKGIASRQTSAGMLAGVFGGSSAFCSSICSRMALHYWDMCTWPCLAPQPACLQPVVASLLKQACLIVL
jgi:hypothetical protein